MCSGKRLYGAREKVWSESYLKCEPFVDVRLRVHMRVWCRADNRAGRAGPKPGRAKIGPVFSGQNFNSPARPKNRAGRAK